LHPLTPFFSKKKKRKKKEGKNNKNMLTQGRRQFSPSMKDKSKPDLKERGLTISR